MIGDHVAGQSNAMMIGAVAKVDIGAFPAEVISDPVIEERIGGGHGIRIAAEQLDGLRGPAALPDADEPKRVEAAMRQCGQIFIGNVIESANMAAVLFA